MRVIRQIILRAVSLLIALACVAAAASCSLPGGKSPSLSYEFQRGANRNEIKVFLEISGLNDDETELYLSDAILRVVNVSSGREKLDYEQQGNVLTIFSPPSKLTVEYNVSVGELGKHGRNGFTADGLIAASGAQLLLLPTDSYSVDDEKVASSVSSIEFSAVADIALGSSIPQGLKQPTWSNLYRLRKSSFVFTSLLTEEYQTAAGSLYIDYADGMEAEKEKVTQLYDFFCDVFDTAPSVLRICLLNKTASDEYIFAGAGGYSIGATFDGGLSRDWELLAHRMFHAFIDEKIQSYIPHTQENIWLYEGLAVYYERLAADAISVAPGRQESFSGMFANYLYMREKMPDDFVIIPSAADDETTTAAEEFLHYTQAPLVVLAASVSRDSVLDSFIGAAAENDSAGQFPAKVFASAGADEDFISSYVNGSDILPLWEMKPSEDTDIIASLKGFEEEICSWLTDLPANYIRYNSASPDKLDEIAALAEENGITFDSDTLTAAVKDYSPEIYSLLMKHSLKKSICGDDLASADGLDKWRGWLENHGVSVAY